MASTTMGTTSDTSEQHISIISMIKQDHSKFRSLWDEYRGPNMTNELKQKLGWAIIREVAMHCAAVEEIMYPEVRKRLGNEDADHLLGNEGHQRIKNLLYEVNNMTIEKNGEANYTEKLDEAMKFLYTHMREEANDVWPRFEALPGVDADLLCSMGKKFETAKHHAVTRPHPWAPNKPPLNIAANMMTAPMDAMADMWRFAGNPPQL